jgi:hypothetical protein
LQNLAKQELEEIINTGKSIETVNESKLKPHQGGGIVASIEGRGE